MYYYGASPTMTGYPPTGNGTALVTLTPEVVGIMPEANRRELAQRLPIASFKRRCTRRVTSSQTASSSIPGETHSRVASAVMMWTMMETMIRTRCPPDR